MRSAFNDLAALCRIAGRRRLAFASGLATLLATTHAAAGAATCVNGNVTIVPLPLPSAAYTTFGDADPGTKIYSYDLITVTSGKTSQNYLPIARIACDPSGIHITVNGLTTSYPLTATVTSHSLRTWALYPGLGPTASEAAQIRMGRTRLVRTVTVASATAAAAATPSPVPSPSPSATPKHRHFL